MSCTTQMRNMCRMHLTQYFLEALSINVSQSACDHCMYTRSPSVQQNKVRKTSLALLVYSFYAYLVLRLCSYFLEQRVTLQLCHHGHGGSGARCVQV